MVGRTENDPPEPRASFRRAVARRWNAYWFDPISPHGFALFRILFGLYLLGYFLPLAPEVELLFSSAGIYTPVVLPDIAPGPVGAQLLFGALVVAAALFTLGVRTSWTTPILLSLYVYHFCINLAIKDSSYDRLLVLILFFACFARLDEVLSLTAFRRSRRAGGSMEPQLVPPWAGRLIAFQIAILYFGSGVWKLLQPTWKTGEMMRMTLIGPWGTPAAHWVARLDLAGWIYDVATWSVVVFELAAGFALYVRRLRWLAIAMGVFFHTGIWVLLGIYEFMFCAAVYVLFLDPEWVRRCFERVVSRSRPRG